MDPITSIWFVAGLVLLIWGAEVLVRGAARLASAFGISPLVVGLTVVAFATSAPELAVSMRSSWVGSSGLALGNVVGSNIANILLILGVSALAAPLIVHQKLVRLDVPLMIVISFAVLALGLDGSLGRLDGALLATTLVVYVVWTIRASRRETQAVREEYEGEFGDGATTANVLWNTALVVMGLGMLVLGAYWLVESAKIFAHWLGASELVIGLTVVAIGTSLPELATSVVAALRGQRDIAVGNAIGSNIFNLLSVLGITALVAPNPIAVPAAVRGFDLPFMIAVAVACLPIFFVGHKISRGNGAWFLFYYGAYLTYLVLEQSEHEALPFYDSLMLGFVVPLTLATLVIYVVRHLRVGQAGAAES